MKIIYTYYLYCLLTLDSNLYSILCVRVLFLSKCQIYESLNDQNKRDDSQVAFSGYRTVDREDGRSRDAVSSFSLGGR